MTTLLTPLAGPLALFSQGLSRWAHSAAPFRRVEPAVHDSSIHTAAAMHETAKEHRDLPSGSYGTGPMVAAARSTRRVIWNHGAYGMRNENPRTEQSTGTEAKNVSPYEKKTETMLTQGGHTQRLIHASVTLHMTFSEKRTVTGRPIPAGV